MIREDLTTTTALSDWVEHNLGVPFSMVGAVPYGSNELRTWGSGTAHAVQFLQILTNQGGHQWPGYVNPPSTEGTIATLSSAATAWEFFKTGELVP